MASTWIGALAFLLSVGVLAAPAGAQVVHVWPSGPPCNGTLQACIDAAGAGDEIRIATNGTIEETVSFSKSLTLRAQTGYEPLFSMGGITADTGSTGDKTIRVEGLRFDRSVVGLTQSSTGNATFQVLDNTFSGGFIGFGGSLPGAGPASFLVSGNTMTDLLSSGVTVGSLTSSMTGSITDNSFTMLVGANPAIELRDMTTTDVLRNRISGPQTAIHLTGTLTARVVGNLLVGPGGSPFANVDGIQVRPGTNGSLIEIVNNTIVGWNDGIWIDDRPQDDRVAEGVIANNLITHNLVGVKNAGIRPDAYIQELVNNLFFANSIADLSYTQNLGFSAWVEDPLYVSSSDYHLQPGSPAIDGGDDAFAAEGVTTDLDGKPRIQGEAIDVGAYEAPEPGALASGLAAVLTLVLCRRAARAWRWRDA